MKIPDIKGLMSIAGGVLDPKRAQTAKDQKPAAGKPDSVVLSTESQDISRLASAGRSDSKARTNAVSELKALHERGELKPDPEAIADAMINKGYFDDLIQE